MLNVDKILCNFILQFKRKDGMEMAKDSEWSLEVPAEEL